VNERIKQLWDQAAQLESDPSWAGQTKFMEKFAELIVRECIELNKQELAFNAFERMLDRYREHFGVDGMSTEDKKTLIKELLGVKND